MSSVPDASSISPLSLCVPPAARQAVPRAVLRTSAMSSKSWFDHAFSDRAQAEQLLRPDLENGLLTPHDFELAVSFLPGPVRYLPYFHTAAWATLAGLAVYRFKPKVRFPTTIVGVSAVSGYGFGILHYASEHKKFARQLQDREAFLVVLDNVNRRMGNNVPLFPQVDRDKILNRIKKRREENGEVLDTGLEIVNDIGDSTDGTALADSSGATAPGNGMSSLAEVVRLSFTRPHLFAASQDPSPRQKGAWDAIREANARNTGRHSSWDELRERHERQRTAGRVQQKEAAEVEDPRAKAQAEFDAILEAERKAASAA
ncbi:hypothetical protein C8Q78DRAFT_1017612 [Trametes maxima]|nr:hypothetical protein C8Q78DRAFT_1017612 [Trametes maxima]